METQLAIKHDMVYVSYWIQMNKSSLSNHHYWFYTHKCRTRLSQSIYLLFTRDIYYPNRKKKKKTTRIAHVINLYAVCLVKLDPSFENPSLNKMKKNGFLF